MTNPTAIAAHVRELGVDHHDAVRVLVNALARNEGLAPPWDAPVLDLPTLASIEEIGEVHQVLLGGQSAERGEQGSYYTPEVLAEWITRFSVDLQLRERHPLNILACDPACGAGIFLVQAAWKLARALAMIEVENDDPPEWMVTGLLPLVQSECIFGVDIDPIAVDLAKSALWIQARGLPPITWMDRNIIVGDPLQGDEPPKLVERRPTQDTPAELEPCHADVLLEVANSGRPSGGESP